MPTRRILFTGATSFTGMWFVKKLTEAGHDVTAAIRRGKNAYAGLKLERLEQIPNQCSIGWNAPFGTPEFLDLIVKMGPFNILCHHAAEVADYKRPDFQIATAVAANTRGLPAVLDRLHQTGCRHVVLTGSIFESDEGMGTMPLRSFSPYGTSKTRTAQIIREETEKRGMALGKFVIPNPFGPYEEPRFTDYLMRCWKEGRPAKVNTPAYVRDNIPVTLLAQAYARFAAAPVDAGFDKLTPSFYAETQAAFATRFGKEMGRRLAIDCALDLAAQTEFPEPQTRVGTDVLHASDFGWSEAGFWDTSALYYAGKLGIPVRQPAG